MNTIENYLVVFPGFYGTNFSSDFAEENALDETDLNYDNLDFDYKDYQNRVANACINSVWNFLKLDNFKIDIQFDEVNSPREYNFRNDDIYCTYLVNDEDLTRLVDYCKANISDFKTFLEDNYSSRSGFVSFFSTDLNTWFNEYLNKDNSKFAKAFTGILEFYLLNEGYSVYKMLDDVIDERSYIDYKILTTS